MPRSFLFKESSFGRGFLTGRRRRFLRGSAGVLCGGSPDVSSGQPPEGFPGSFFGGSLREIVRGPRLAMELARGFLDEFEFLCFGLEYLERGLDDRCRGGRFPEVLVC
jgi:hypothetical protein